ncbi:hypothetical protein J2S50_000809 [Streptomyces sp. DSM 40167]|nr:hypothetical protein [Streptomyces sp. DSM 40167]
MVQPPSTGRATPITKLAPGTAQPQGAEVSRQNSSTVTDNVPEGMAEWRSRPLGTVYPVAFIDAIHEKNRNGAIATRPIYAALAVTTEGRREILGLWAGDGGEGAKRWLHILTEIKNRGVSAVLVDVGCPRPSAAAVRRCSALVDVGEAAVVLFVVGEGDADADEGGRPFAYEDAPSVGAFDAGGFGFEAADPGGDAEADGGDAGEVGVFASDADVVHLLDDHGGSSLWGWGRSSTSATSYSFRIDASP